MISSMKTEMRYGFMGECISWEDKWVECGGGEGYGRGRGRRRILIVLMGIILYCLKSNFLQIMINIRGFRSGNNGDFCILTNWQDDYQRRIESKNQPHEQCWLPLNCHYIWRESGDSSSKVWGWNVGGSLNLNSVNTVILLFAQNKRGRNHWETSGAEEGAWNCWWWRVTSWQHTSIFEFFNSTS